MASVVRFYGLSINEVENEPYDKIMRLFYLIDALQAKEFSFLRNVQAYGVANAKGRDKINAYYDGRLNDLIGHLQPSKSMDDFLKGMSGG